MIRNNLSLLLTERSLKAVDVSKDTKIAQSTLSKISNNSTEKIDYSTINTLCTYLSIEPKDFFTFIPLDILINLKNIDLRTKPLVLKENITIPELDFFVINGYLTVKDNTEDYIEYTYGITIESISVERNTKDFLSDISSPTITFKIKFETLENHENISMVDKHFTDEVWIKLDTPFRVQFIKTLKAEILALISDKIIEIYETNLVENNENQKNVSIFLKKRYLNSKINMIDHIFNL